MSKTLVTYFSASGVTAKVAAALAEAADADICEIKPAVPYTAADLDWRDKSSRSTVEMSDPSARVDIAEMPTDLTPYDTIFVGFPIWWYVAPRIIDTFLEKSALEGKTVVPFATSGGSGMGETEAKLRALCPDSVNWKSGRIIRPGTGADALKKWIAELGL